MLVVYDVTPKNRCECCCFGARDYSSDIWFVWYGFGLMMLVSGAVLVSGAIVVDM